MLMAADKDYRKLQLHVTHLVLSAIQRNHYRLLVVGNQAVGCVLWAEISTATLDHCLQQQREPGPDQLLAHGDAILATGLVATTPRLVKQLWRHFVRLNAARPILAVRHFGKYANNPKFIVYRNGRQSH